MKAPHVFAFCMAVVLSAASHAGAFYNGVCYSTVNEASNAFFSNMPIVVVPGSTSYRHTYSYNSATDAWTSTIAQSSGTGAWVGVLSTSAVKAFPACEPAQGFLDGMTVGWGVGSVLIAVAALMMMRRAAR